MKSPLAPPVGCVYSADECAPPTKTHHLRVPFGEADALLDAMLIRRGVRLF